VVSNPADAEQQEVKSRMADQTMKRPLVPGMLLMTMMR